MDHPFSSDPRVLHNGYGIEIGVNYGAVIESDVSTLRAGLYE